MFGETTISYVKIWNHPIETTIYKWLFGVLGKYQQQDMKLGPQFENSTKTHVQEHYTSTVKGVPSLNPKGWWIDTL